MPDNWTVAILNRGKSGLRKDNLPVNGWRGQPQG